jgi:ribonuclease BN (tRNA processing enzyme)
VRSLADVGLDLSDIERVVISHFHVDHVLDLHALAFARKNPHLDPARLRPLEVIGPAGLTAFMAAEGADPEGSSLAATWQRAPRQSLHEVRPGQMLRRGDVKLRCSQARHSPEALSWRVESGGVSLVFSGDTGECPELVELARGADLLVAECAFGPDEEPELHLNAAAAAHMAREAGVGVLLLTHFYPHVDPVAATRDAEVLFGGPVFAAEDGMRVGVGPAGVRIEARA